MQNNINNKFSIHFEQPPKQSSSSQMIKPSPNGFFSIFFITRQFKMLIINTYLPIYIKYRKLNDVRLYCIFTFLLCSNISNSLNCKLSNIVIYNYAQNIFIKRTLTHKFFQTINCSSNLYKYPPIIVLC